MFNQSWISSSLFLLKTMIFLIITSTNTLVPCQPTTFYIFLSISVRSIRFMNCCISPSFKRHITYLNQVFVTWLFIFSKILLILWSHIHICLPIQPVSKVLCPQTPSQSTSPHLKITRFLLNRWTFCLTGYKQRLLFLNHKRVTDGFTFIRKI